MKIIKRYMFFIVSLLVMLTLMLISRETGMKAIKTTVFSLKEMLLVVPPIFILLGLLDVWVSKETMIKYLGEGSGLKGILISIFLGSAAAGPLYGAFPVAGVFLKKGAKLSNVILFLGAWSTTKIPLVLFEISSLGIKFALTRLAASITGIILIALVSDRLMSKSEKERIYENALKMS